MFVFWAPCGSWQGTGGWGDVWGHGECPYTCAHTHAHVYKLQMAANMEASMFNMHVGVCMHVCVCVFMEHLPHTHTHLQPNPATCHLPQWGTSGISQNSITLGTNQDNSIVWRFEICGESSTHGWVHSLVGWLMGGSGQITKNWINVDPIKITQFFFWRFMICRDTPTNGWVSGWGQVKWLNI